MKKVLLIVLVLVAGYAVGGSPPVDPPGASVAELWWPPFSDWPFTTDTSPAVDSP